MPAKPADTSAKFTVVGTRTVAGAAPGETLTAEAIEAAGGSVEHLVASGHIAPATTPSPKEP